jgi:hypothetical protein
LPHLWPTGSSSGQPPSITARYFSSCPSDSISRWTPCPPENCRSLASGPPWRVSGFRFRARLGFSIPFTFSGPRGITPAFGYSAPHSSARGTSTLLSNALLSAHYSAVRLLEDVHAGRTAFAFARRPVAILPFRHLRGLPVLVHGMFRRAWGLRLRRVAQQLALSLLFVWPSAQITASTP